eukprot:NODE_624_length_5893_cov_0.149465.p1 type:complete len:340 gc:universal NODE_624_length_5893_cov_0.149465:4284-3265(-)
MNSSILRHVGKLPSKINNLAERWISQVVDKSQIRNDYLKLMENNSKSDVIMDYKERQVLAYIAGYFPSIYAQNYSVLKQLTRHPNTYKSILDVGSGLGTSLMALNELKYNGKMSAFDISQDMLVKCREYADSQNLKIDLLQSLPKHQHDLIVCSHTLSSIQKNLRITLLDEMWKLTRKTLVIIDRGNPEMFSTIGEFRIKAKKNGTVMAPCTHDGFCPLLMAKKLGNSNWCHFAQRTVRPKFTKITKNSKHDCEDTKYTYLIMHKGEVEKKDLARITNSPLKQGGHVLLDICKDEKWRRISVPKSMGVNIYTEARKARWGDAWNHEYKSVIRQQPGVVE